jgi:hypothetical protein
MLAILGLSFSAFAVCACTHHLSKTIKSETVSCHGSSHEDPPPERAEGAQTGPSAGVDCECPMSAIGPAIIVTNKSKRLDNSGQMYVAMGDEVRLDEPSTVAYEPAVSVFSDPKFYSTPFSRSGPSRAPPRL